MRVYYDGSQAVSNCGTQEIFAWGHVFINGDEQTEIFGHRVRRKTECTGLHELFAFVEAVLYVHSHGFTPEETVFYTDDAATVYASQCRTEYGISSGHQDALERQLRRLEKIKAYSSQVLQLVREFLLKARFQWIKGHRRTVYNLRCDYLAKIASMQARGAVRKLLDFERWITAGFSCFNHEAQASVIWHAPFAPVRSELPVMGATSI